MIITIISYNFNVQMSLRKKKEEEFGIKDEK